MLNLFKLIFYYQASLIAEQGIIINESVFYTNEMKIYALTKNAYISIEINGDHEEKSMTELLKLGEKIASEKRCYATIKIKGDEIILDSAYASVSPGAINLNLSGKFIPLGDSIDEVRIECKEDVKYSRILWHNAKK
jgi:hypothetical protein